MKSKARKISANRVIALALTWDGARWPLRALPPKARVFLGQATGEGRLPSAQKAALLLSQDQVQEIRICWVPRLKGGATVLSDPFQTASGLRIPFRAVKTNSFGDILGVVYRRS